MSKMSLGNTCGRGVFLKLPGEKNGAGEALGVSVGKILNTRDLDRLEVL